MIYSQNFPRGAGENQNDAPNIGQEIPDRLYVRLALYFLTNLQGQGTRYPGSEYRVKGTVHVWRPYQHGCRDIRIPAADVCHTGAVALTAGKSTTAWTATT